MAREPIRYNTPVAEPKTGWPTDYLQRLWQNTLAASGPIITLRDSQQPSDKGTLVIEATSDTTLTFRYKGSDGVVRSAALTLT